MNGHLLLLAVPGTAEGGEPVVRVVVIPRLDAADSVAAAGLADWPTILSDARFTIELAVTAPAEQQTQLTDLVPRHNADPSVWTEFFADLRVAAAEPAAIGAAPVVSRTTEQAKTVDSTYRAAAQISIAPDAVAHPEFDQTVTEELRTNWATDDTVPPVAQAPQAMPRHDFHLVLTRLREHPAVMRALGLIFDLPVETDLGRAGTVRVRWPSAPAELPRPVSPRTAYEVNDEAGFLPASTDLIKAGMLDLGDPVSWSTATFDVDGAVGRLRDAARSIPAEGRGLPALRSAGIQLLRPNLETDLGSRRANAAANADTARLDDAPPLTADDLMLGIRLDVRRRGDVRWTSLCRRLATYRVNDQPIQAQPEEEGHVKFGAAIRDNGGALTADEVVARWTGWSLAAPRPRQRQNQTGNQQRADLPFAFDWAFDVPTGSLMPLRFGSDYQLRGRVLDIAGGGIGYRNQDSTRAGEWVAYTRHQPISAPTVMPGDDPKASGPGDRVDFVVLRGDAPEYPDNTTRILAAPIGTLELAEQHDQLNDSDETAMECLSRAIAGTLRDWASEGLTFFPMPEVPGGPAQDPQYFHWPHPWSQDAAWTVKLAARDQDDTVEPDPDRDDLLWIRLAPAEQLTVEVSSLPREQIVSQFALRRWRESAVDQTVKNGRHPMVTPSRTITFVHAVRKPIKDPTGTLDPKQNQGDTTATLVHAPPLLGMNAASTVQLQLTGRWREVNDNIEQELIDVRIQDVPVERGDEELRETLVHSFGDTRHRWVTYTLNAISRFRHLYHSDEDDRRFIASTTLQPISIKSTARPAPPAVRAVVPAFRWSTDRDGPIVRRRVRTGGLLRVELYRPWYVTGEGEQLAVVVEQTEAGRDPIWQTGPVDRTPPLSAYRPQDHRTAKLPDGTAVTIVPYDAKFAEDRWVADVELPELAAASYRPFVRLAVARYQRESLKDLKLSTVVRTNLVQLLPDRTLTIEPTGDDLVVRLDGLGPDGPHPNRVDVILERRTGAHGVEVTNLGNAAGQPGWTAIDTFSGTLGQPITVSQSYNPGDHARLRIREVEVFDPPPAGRATTLAELDDRVVFTDLISLTGDPDNFSTDPTNEYGKEDPALYPQNPL